VGGGTVPPPKAPAELERAPKQQVVAPDLSDAALAAELRPLNERKRKFEILAWSAFGLAFFVFLGASIMASNGGRLLSLSGMALGGLLLWGSRACIKEKKVIISAHVIQGMLADNFELIEYIPHHFFQKQQLGVSQLQGWSTNKGNDFFRAKYKGVSFAFSDVWLGNGRTTTFKGHWLILDLHKEIPAPLIISELEKWGELGQEAWIYMAQEPFRDTFTTLTKSPELLSQVLTPAFIEFLLTTRHPFGYTFSFHQPKHLFFGGTQVHFSIHTNHDSFEPCDDAQDVPALRVRVQREIDFIKNVIDGFLLIDGLFEEEKSDEEAEKRKLYTRLTRCLANRVSE